MTATGDLIRRLPKAELHLHLEGTIAPQTLWDMAQANHVALPVSSLTELKSLYTFKSFAGFIELWLLMCSCMRTPDDYLRMVDAFVAERSERAVQPWTIAARHLRQHLLSIPFAAIANYGKYNCSICGKF